MKHIDYQHVSAVSSAIQQILDSSGQQDAKAADLMPALAKRGLLKETSRPGSPLRDLCRDLDEANALNRLPQVRVERGNANRQWFFNAV